jgi:putative ABC transport system permease protein
VIAVISLVQGMNRYVSDRLLAEGSDVFWVDKYGLVLDEDAFREAAKRPDITEADADAVADVLGGQAYVKSEASAGLEVKAGSRKAQRINVRGVAGDYQIVDALEVSDGRALAALDVERRRSVAVLGWEVADQLFPGTDPAGRSVDVEGRRFEIAGVAKKKGSFFGESQDRYVLVPLGALQKLLPYEPGITIGVKVRDAGRLQQVQDEVRAVLRARRHVKVGAPDDFGITTAEAFLDLWKSFTGTAFIVVVGVAGISLVVGGIVIMNTMLVSVTERTREIGVRKALGARRRDVLLQFLVEAVTLSLVGGAIGVGLGVALALIIGAISPLPSAVSGPAILLGVAMSALVGVFFGVYPAARAARLDPVDALRYE